MSAEFESLREEIRQWQNRRFTVLAATVALVTGVLGLKAVSESSVAETWPIVSSLLLAFLACSAILTWYCGHAGVKIGTFLRVFHEPTSTTATWETALEKLKSNRRDPTDLNHVILLVYMVLGAISVIVPFLPHEGDHLVLGSNYLLLIVCAAVFISTLVLLAIPRSRNKFVTDWQDVKKALNPPDTQGQTPPSETLDRNGRSSVNEMER